MCLSDSVTRGSTYTGFIEGTVVNVQGLNILVGATFSD